jgi:energy-coupling factor transport system permease protein
LVSAVMLYLGTGYSASALNPSFYPLRFPPLPAVPAVAILIAALAAFAAPPPQRQRRVSGSGVAPPEPPSESVGGQIARPKVAA